MSDPKDFADSIYGAPTDRTIPRSEGGGLRVMAVTECCKTSKELEAREAKILAENAAAEAAGIELVTFWGEDGREEVSMTEAERDLLRDQYTPEEWERI